MITEKYLPLILTSAGIKSFDVWTSTGRFAAVIGWNKKRDDYSVFFNSNATRGSKRRFKSVDDAVTFVRERRVKKGWSL